MNDKRRSPLRPLVVYLDTQDYLNLFYSDRGSPTWDTARELLALRDEGAIAIGYSAFIILEFITRPSFEYRRERVERGKLLKEICGRNAFPSIIDLGRGHRFPNDGHWLSSKDKSFLRANDLRRQMKAEFEKTLRETPGFNRKLRRQMQARGMQAVLKEFMPESSWVKRAAAGLPVSKEFIEGRYLERLLLGEITDADFEEAANKWASDPEEFSRIVYEYSGSENMLDRFFGETISKLESTHAALTALLDEMVALNKKAIQVRARLIKGGMDRATAKKLTRETKNPFEGKKLDLSRLAEKIGEDRVGHFQIYFEKVMRPGQRFKRSDVFDIWHFVYAYDCDFFRCDKAMWDKFRDYEPLKDRLAPSFQKLPAAIRVRLASQA